MSCSKKEDRGNTVVLDFFLWGGCGGSLRESGGTSSFKYQKLFIARGRLDVSGIGRFGEKKQKGEG